jgi:hypothetical protein
MSKHVYVVVARTFDYENSEDRAVVAYANNDDAHVHASAALGWRNHKNQCRATSMYPNPYDKAARYFSKQGQPDYDVEAVEVKDAFKVEDWQ